MIPERIGKIVEFAPGVFAEEVREEAARQVILEMETGD